VWNCEWKMNDASQRQVSGKETTSVNRENPSLLAVRVSWPQWPHATPHLAHLAHTHEEYRKGDSERSEE